MARHIRKGDLVVVNSGALRAENPTEVERRTARVLRVLPKKGKVVVEGVNVRRKHVKPSQTNPQGGVVDKELPIDISNVQPVAEGKPSRWRFEARPDGAKVGHVRQRCRRVGPELKKPTK